MGYLKDSVKGSFSKFARSRDCARWICFPQLLAAGFVFFMHGYLCYNGFMLLGMPAYAAGYEDAADPVSKFLWTFGEQANAPGTQHSPYNNTAGNNRSSLNTPLAGNDDSTGADKTPALCVPFVWLFRLCVVLVRFIIGVCFVPIGGACWIMTWVCLMFSLIYCISAPEESSAPPVDTLPPVIATATAVNEPAPVATSEVRVIYEDPVAIPVKGGNDKV